MHINIQNSKMHVSNEMHSGTEAKKCHNISLALGYSFSPYTRKAPSFTVTEAQKGVKGKTKPSATE